MARLHEKYLWPLVGTGIVIFVLLAVYYIDDRIRLAQQNTDSMTRHDANHNPASHHNKQSSADRSESMHASLQVAKKSNNATDGSIAKYQGFSGSIEGYLAQISSERNDELIAAVKDHQGFSGSLEEYLNGGTPKQATVSEQPSKDTSNPTSMSMDETFEKVEDKSYNNVTQIENAYSGSIEGYLAKFGVSGQSPKLSNETDPFQNNEGMNFRGSYKEYAEKYD